MIHGRLILVDPMLGSKGSLGPFPWTNDDRDNPLTDLPFPNATLNQYLDLIDVVTITHLHPDHLDETAIKLLLERQTLIICPSSIANQIAGYGFANVTAITDRIQWNGISISVTGGRHGNGEIGEVMGPVCGFVFNCSDDSVYVAGDTVWCSEVESALSQFRPQNVILAAGAAQFSIGDAVTMTFADIQKVCESAPYANVWVTHLDTIVPCQENRVFVRSQISASGLASRCFALDDGQTVFLKTTANNSPSSFNASKI